MSIESVAAVVGGTPYMSVDQAQRMADLIAENNLARVLELGFAHGVSTCYLADAVGEMPNGFVTSIDLTSSAELEPRAEDLLERCGLSSRVDLIREPRSFTWRIMYWLAEGRSDCFDLVYLDGGHTWDVTGFAFFLVDRLLAPGGWLVFDDIDWTVGASPFYRQSGRADNLPEDFRTTQQVRNVFELLVTPHQSYVDATIVDGWGMARKSLEAH